MRNLLLVTVMFLGAGVTFASDLPPYNDLLAINTLFIQQGPDDEKELKIFPNPITDGRLNIKSGEPFHLIQLLNITGEIVFSQEYPSGTNSEVIEVTNFEKGMYLIRIGFQGKPNHTAKIIIK